MMLEHGWTWAEIQSSRPHEHATPFEASNRCSMKHPTSRGRKLPCQICDQVVAELPYCAAP